MKRIPILPTIIVLLAVAVMVRLGFWQLDRLAQKEALLARYAAAEKSAVEVPFPTNAAAAEAVLYRRSELVCQDFSPDVPVAGENLAGVSGWAHVIQCKQFDGPTAKLVLGWSNDPRPREFRGGRFAGVIAPGPRLVVDAAQSEGRQLQPMARPNPANIPNNHLAYAVQWFLFALTALVIYGLALRKRLAAKGERG